jgi:hypothetical protein
MRPGEGSPRHGPGDNLQVTFAFPGEDLATAVEVEVREARRLVTREDIAHCAIVGDARGAEEIAVWTEARGSE